MSEKDGNCCREIDFAAVRAKIGAVETLYRGLMTEEELGRPRGMVYAGDGQAAFEKMRTLREIGLQTMELVGTLLDALEAGCGCGCPGRTEEAAPAEKKRSART